MGGGEGEGEGEKRERERETERKERRGRRRRGEGEGEEGEERERENEMERERERERKERRGRGRRGRGKGGREGRGSKDAIGRSDRDRKARKPTDASKLKMQFSDSRSKTYQSHSTKKSCAFFLGVLYRGSSIRLLQSGGCPQEIIFLGKGSAAGVHLQECARAESFAFTWIMSLDPLDSLPSTLGQVGQVLYRKVNKHLPTEAPGLLQP